MLGKYNYTPATYTITNDESRNLSWIQGEVDIKKYFPVGERFVLGTRVNSIASTKKLVNNYTANIVQAPAFAPTPSTKGYFNPAFRANSFLAGGLIPLVKFGDNFQIRTEFYAFAPFQKIIEGPNMHAEYGKWFDSVSYMGEASIVYNLPFASFSIYGNCLSYPARNWNFGINIGMLLTAPKFMR